MTPGLTPWMSDKLDTLLRFARKQGIEPKVVSTDRTCAEQNAIYAAGAGVVTQARGCQSWHVHGRAADLEIDGPTSDYRVLGDEWKRMGGVWGGDFSFGDYGHFEWHPGVTIADVCPDPAVCNVSGPPWPEDRPLLERPMVQASLGLILAVGGVALARRMLVG